MRPLAVLALFAASSAGTVSAGVRPQTTFSCSYVSYAVMPPSRITLNYTVTRPRPGDEPSTAREATPGHTYHGNLASQTRDSFGDYHGLWKVRLPGTQVTVSWSHSTGGDMQVDIYANDTDRGNQPPLFSCYVGPHRINTFVVNGVVGGWYYLDFWVSRRPGPYTFTLSPATRARVP